MTADILNKNNKKSEQNKKYYETFKNKGTNKWTCEACQLTISYYSKSDHLKTKKHCNKESPTQKRIEAITLEDIPLLIEHLNSLKKV